MSKYGMSLPANGFPFWKDIQPELVGIQRSRLFTIYTFSHENGCKIIFANNLLTIGLNMFTMLEDSDIIQSRLCLV